jgi:hypothetical protein
MQFGEHLDMAQLEKSFFAFRQRYSENLQTLANDTLRTASLEKRIHFRVEARLKNEIQ